jgi:hypothetical protein
MATTEPLTEREQQALEHMRKAQELGSTLKGYAAKFGLEVQQLYELRRRLVRKGAFGPLPRRKVGEPDKAGAFLPVRVVPAATVPSGTSVTCRLVHPSGWVLECDGLPPASWMAAVVAGGAHATP